MIKRQHSEQDFTIADLIRFLLKWKVLIGSFICAGFLVAFLYYQANRYYRSFLNVEWQLEDAGVLLEAKSINSALGEAFSQFELCRVFADAFVKALDDEIKEGGKL